MQKDGRVLYLAEEKKENQYWNIPENELLGHKNIIPLFQHPMRFGNPNSPQTGPRAEVLQFPSNK